MLYPQMNKCRSLYSLDGIWQFYAERSDDTFDNLLSCDLPQTRNIAVPASWNDQYDDLFQFHGKGIYKKEFDVPQMFSEEYQAKMIKLQYEKFREQPYAIGTHVWAFADFKTAQTI